MLGSFSGIVPARIAKKPSVPIVPPARVAITHAPVYPCCSPMTKGFTPAALSFCAKAIRSSHVSGHACVAASIPALLRMSVLYSTSKYEPAPYGTATMAPSGLKSSRTESQPVSWSRSACGIRSPSGRRNLA